MTHCYTFFLLLCFFVPGRSNAQSGTGRYSLQSFSTENGMPSNGIKGLQWDDKSGFLWMATEAGIVRYNGMEFKTFTNSNTRLIATERMWFITGSLQGYIFCADLSGNILRIHNNELQSWYIWKNKRELYGNAYKLLGVSTNFFKQWGKSTIVSNLNPYFFNELLPLNDTSCIIFYRDKVLLYSIADKEPLILADGGYPIKATFKIGDNCFFIDPQDKAFIFDAAKRTRRQVDCLTEAGSLLTLNHKNSKLFWMPGMDAPVYIEGRNAWLFEYNKGKIAIRLIADNIPTDAFINGVQYSKRRRMLFISTESRGLIIIRQNAVQTKRNNSSNIKKRNAYYAQVALPNNNILTNQGDVIGNDMFPEAQLPIKGKFGFSVSTTSTGVLWYQQSDPVTKNPYLNAYDPKTGITKRYKKCSVGNLAIVVDIRNSIYVATEKGIFLLQDDSLHLLHDLDTPRQADDLVYDMLETAPGILSIATCNGLLNYDIGHNTLTSVFNRQNYCIRTLWKYNDYVFIGTYGAGFYMMKDGKVKAMPLDINKYLLYSHCFVADDRGFCWISTNRGLFKASLTDLINIFEGKGSVAYYHYFGKKDGMEMTELNGGCTPCALKLRNNDISFPSMDGLVWVGPEQPVANLPEGDIYIDNILVGTEKYDPGYLIDHALPPTTNEVIFHLTFSAWCNKENIYLEYKLNDAPGWTPVALGNTVEIRCGALSNGRYTLKIRKLNGFGPNNYSYKEINFSIITPWYKTWWAYLLLFLCIAGIVAVILHLRVRRYRISQQKLERQIKEKTQALLDQNEILENNNTIKTRLISIISHDIVMSLKFVTAAGKNLIEKRELMSDELQQETIREITNTTQELQLLSTNILNWIKYQIENRRLGKETFSPYETIDQVSGILNSLARQKGLTIVNDLDPHLRVHQYFEPLKILIYNLLTNAINFTEKGNITVASQRANKELIITVKDEGVGMTAEQINNVMADQFIVSSINIDKRKGNGLGYLIIKDLVKMMDAKLSISSEKGYGTSVSVQFGMGEGYH